MPRGNARTMVKKISGLEMSTPGVNLGVSLRLTKRFEQGQRPSPEDNVSNDEAFRTGLETQSGRITDDDIGRQNT